MRKRKVQLLVVTVMIEFSALLVVFVVGRTLAERHISLLWMGLIGAGFGLSSSLSSMYFGAMSDRIGRRRSIICGIVLAMVSVYLAWMGLRTIWWNGLAYVSLGVALGCIYPALSAWLTQGGNSNNDTRSLLRTLMAFSVAWNLGLIGAQAIGGWLYEHASPGVTLMTALVTLILILLIVVAICSQPTTDMTTPKVYDDRVTGRLQASSVFSRLSWIANIGGTFAMAMILHLFPALMVEMDIDPSRHGMLLAYSRVIVVGTYALLFLTHFWHYRFSTALVAHVIGAVGLLTLGLTGGEWMLMLGLTGLAILVGYNYFASLYYSSTRSGDEARGSAMGLHEATLAAGMTCGAGLGGVLGSYAGSRAPYMMAAAVVLVLAVVQIILWLQHRDVIRLVRSRPEDSVLREGYV